MAAKGPLEGSRKVWTFGGRRITETITLAGKHKRFQKIHKIFTFGEALASRPAPYCCLSAAVCKVFWNILTHLQPLAKFCESLKTQTTTVSTTNYTSALLLRDKCQHPYQVPTGTMPLTLERTKLWIAITRWYLSKIWFLETRKPAANFTMVKAVLWTEAESFLSTIGDDRRRPDTPTNSNSAMYNNCSPKYSKSKTLEYR